MIFNLSGGGNPLNFKVVGGTSAPANPAENIIWVNTGTAITGWHFDAEEPNVYNIPTISSVDWHSMRSPHKLSDGDILNFKIPVSVDFSLEALAIIDVSTGQYYFLRYVDGTKLNAWPEGTKIGLRISKDMYPIVDHNGIGTAYVMAWDSYYHDEGTVWIQTGDASQVEFNALNKNGIQVYPIGAKQYVGGAWADKTAQIYQNGAWNELVSGYLIKDGEDVTSLTGGWQHATMGMQSNAFVHPDITYNNGAMSVMQTTGTAAALCITTVNAIDLTDVKTIEVTCDAYAQGNSYQGSENWIDLSVATTPNTAATATVNLAKQGAKSGTFALDVSSLTGNYYIGFRGMCWVTGGLKLGVNVYNLELKG